MGIGFSQLTTRNSLVSVHADSKGLRIEASKETEMLQDGKSSENHVYGIQDTILRNSGHNLRQKKIVANICSRNDFPTALSVPNVGAAITTT